MDLFLRPSFLQVANSVVHPYFKPHVRLDQKKRFEKTGFLRNVLSLVINSLVDKNCDLMIRIGRWHVQWRHRRLIGNQRSPMIYSRQNILKKTTTSSALLIFRYFRPGNTIIVTTFCQITIEFLLNEARTNETAIQRMTWNSRILSLMEF